MTTATRPGGPIRLPVLERPERSRDLCTDCGVSRSDDPSRCGKACQFINPRYEELELATHGRTRDAARPDELFFGPFRRMIRARLAPARPGAQWSGITTTIGERLLASGQVEAVLATASDPTDPWRPVPVLVRRPEDMAACRGMKMGFSPLLALLDDVAALGITRLAVIGIPCQVHALRALEQELGFERLYVIGTPCSDNTTTERFHQFLALLTSRPREVTYFEFLTDFTVELRFADGVVQKIPFLALPISSLPDDFIPATCRACFDYTNALADLTVGYLAGEGDQWLLVRNERGEELLRLVEADLAITPLRSVGRREGAVRAFHAALLRAANGLPTRRAPRWLRPAIGWAMTRFGPKGLEFARTRVEMKVIEGIVTLGRRRPHRLRRMVPEFAWALAARYGIRRETAAPGKGTQ